MNASTLPILAIPDDRSLFPVLSLAWRTDPQHEREARELLAKGLAQSDRWGHPWRQITGDSGSMILTVAAEQPRLERWLHAVADESSRVKSGLVSKPMIAMVGKLAGAENLLATATDLCGAKSSQPMTLPSKMQQNSVEGYQRTLITGEDPIHHAGAAASFLALCLLTGGSWALLPKLVEDLGNAATAQISRNLIQRGPAITWQGICQGTGGMQVFEYLVHALPSQLKSIGEDQVQELKHFGLANLSRAWRSPTELAHTASQYQVMGWGPSLITDAHSELGRVTRDDLEHAMDCLLRPVLEVLGRS
ncbi:hypothetical protein [Glutamicibacter sp.]|uniref:hypothetical protein n=1 Tax=Glutamicibacter sp. TaxID=1931995 RepID=UPI002FE423B9